MTFRHLTALSFAVALSLIMNGHGQNHAHAQAQPDASEVAPEARALLEQVGKTYKAMPGYADQGEISLIYSEAGEQDTQTSPKRFAFESPNKVAIDMEPTRLVSDGETMVTVIDQKYYTEPAPKTLAIEALAGTNPVANFYFNGPAGIPSMVLFRLLTADDPASTILQGIERAVLERDREINGKPHKSLRITMQSNAPRVRLLIDPDSKLLNRVELLPNPEVEQPESFRIESLVWNAGAISTEAPDESTFTYQPDEGAEEVASIPELMGIAQIAPGQPAPDFTLTALGAGDKTQSISKADLSGKVVVLDFWATWCGPCMQELPEIAKLVERYANSDNADQVRVVALSIDDGEPDDLGTVRRLVESTLVQQDLNLARDPVGIVALDPAQEVASAFNVEAIPMLMILDQKGVIQAVHVGFDPNVDLVGMLSEEIDTLLEGKSLVPQQGE